MKTIRIGETPITKTFSDNISSVTLKSDDIRYFETKTMINPDRFIIGVIKVFVSLPDLDYFEFRYILSSPKIIKEMRSFLGFKYIVDITVPNYDYSDKEYSNYIKTIEDITTLMNEKE